MQYDLSVSEAYQDIEPKQNKYKQSSKKSNMSIDTEEIEDADNQFTVPLQNLHPTDIAHPEDIMDSPVEENRPT